MATRRDRSILNETTTAGPHATTMAHSGPKASAHRCSRLSRDPIARVHIIIIIIAAAIRHTNSAADTSRVETTVHATTRSRARTITSSDPRTNPVSRADTSPVSSRAHSSHVETTSHGSSASSMAAHTTTETDSTSRTANPTRRSSAQATTTPTQSTR